MSASRKTLTSRLAAACIGVAALIPLLARSGYIHAAEVKVLSGNGAKAAITELAARFEQATGHKVSLHFEVNPAVRKRIEGGEAFDVAVLNPPVLDALIALGRVTGGSRAVFGRSGISMAVRTGAPKPDITTVEGFKSALLNAKSVAYPGEGASGKYFEKVVERIGIAAQMKATMRPMPAETTVEVVARGDVDMVVVVASRIAGVDGVDVVGPIPEGLQTWIGFAAGVSSGTREREASSAFVQFLAAPTATPVLKAFGVER